MNPVQQITPTIVAGMGLALAAAAVLEGIAEQLSQSRQAIARGDGGAMLTRTQHDLEAETPALVSALVAAAEVSDAAPAPADAAAEVSDAAPADVPTVTDEVTTNPEA